jgi:hypothetical protein
MEDPLAPFVAEMVEHLVLQGYVPETVIRKMRLVGKLNCFLQETGRAAGGLDTGTLEEFASEFDLLRSDRATSTMLSWLIEFLVERGGLAPAQPPDEDLLNRYRRYLAVKPGSQSKTVITYARVAQRFLLEHPEDELGSINCAAVTHYVTCESRHLGRIRAAERLVTGPRSVLRFAWLDGVISSSLNEVVPSAARRAAHRCRERSLPSSWQRCWRAAIATR